MYPKLDDIIKEADVQQKGTGAYTASYVNWSRVAKYLREHAPGWQPFAAPAPDGGIVWPAPDGTGFLMIGFRKQDAMLESMSEPMPEAPPGMYATNTSSVSRVDVSITTELVPHAIMDHKLKAKTNPDARDVADAFVRGMCKAAALLFGLGWRLWSKDDPFDRDDDEHAPRQRPASRPGTAAERFDFVEDAIAALERVGDGKDLAAWADRMKASNFQGDDRAKAAAAFKAKQAELNGAGVEK